MIDPVMVETTRIQGIIRSESIGIHDTVRLNALLNNGHQCFGACVGNYGRVNFVITLQQTENSYLPGSSTSAFSFSHPIETAFIGFNLAR